MNTFESRLFAALEKPIAGKLLLAAVSGGADSTAMLAALAALREEAGFTLHCVHVEHGIRPADESRGDAGAVAALCKRLDVPCRVISVPPGRVAAYAAKGGTGIEAAARFFRLKALAGEALRLEADWILTAHTRDDLLENLFMRILRGSGPAGLSPMPRIKGRRLRPLLGLTRRDVLDYLEEKGIPYRTDTTNADIRYLRNRVRLKLIPVLDVFFPSWRASLLALAEKQALTAEFLSAEVCKRLQWEAPEAGAALRLPEEDFFNSPLILREEAVLAGVDKLAAINKRKHGHPPRRASLRRAVECGSFRRGPLRPMFPSGVTEHSGNTEDLGPVRLERKDGFVVLKPAAKARSETGFSLLINEAGSYTLKGRVSGLGKDLSISAGTPTPLVGTDGFSAGKTTGFPLGKAIGFAAAFPVVFRNHRKGDSIFKGGRERRFCDVDKFPLSVYTGVITVSDKGGPVAFITAGEDLTVISGEDRTGATEGSFFAVSWKRNIHGNTGGTNAKRSER
jgi:tRNA(Ile)-lysidine synthase